MDHVTRRTGRIARFVMVLATTILALSAATAAAAPLPQEEPSAATADAEQVTWSVRPSDGAGADGRSWVEIELDPGAVTTEHLVVQNFSTEAVEFRLVAVDGYFTDSGRFNMLPADRASTGAGTWVTMQRSVAVGPGGSAVVPFTITVPSDAAPGDHPAGVAAVVSSVGSGDGTVGVDSRVGFRVMTRVTGETVAAASVDLSSAYATSWNPFEPGLVRVAYRLTNEGNVRLHMRPTIEIDPLMGESVLVAGEEIVEIAPGETRAGEVTVGNVWPVGNVTISLEPRASSVPDELEAASTGELSTSVRAVPWPQALVLLLATSLLLLHLKGRDQRRTRLETMLERAREEGARAAHGDAPDEDVVPDAPHSSER